MSFTTTKISPTENITSFKKTSLLKLLRSLPVLLLSADCLGLLVCIEITLVLRLERIINPFEPVVLGFSCLVLMGLYLADAYHPENQIAGLRAPYRVMLSMGLVAVFTSALIYISGTWFNQYLTGRGILLPTLGIFTIWAVALRVLAAQWLRSQAKKTSWLMLGTDENSIKFTQQLLIKRGLGKLFVLSDEENPTYSQYDQINSIGRVDDLSNWSQNSWSIVIVSESIQLSESQMQLLRQMRLRGIPVYKVPDMYEALCYKLPSSLLHDRWFAFSNGFCLIPGDFNIKVKKLIDIILAGLLFLCLSPFMLLVAIVIKLDSPGPVFYSQMRTGLNNKPFRVYKFRSMYQDAEKRGAQWAGEKDPRITRVGRWLRLARIDELPQIWNVIRGDMSLIGPRPERPEFDANLQQEIPYYQCRYMVRPGITGWAQVMYPYGASVEDAYEKLSYDLYYIKNYSIWLDLAIAFKTIRVVLLGKGR
ncbi:sugar transferase [Calothrix rhizosoleniae]|uniref:sugar transferase n=1 Tax=Calothrix rhizosoleniae TaxID=888997 RepID=UPI000B4997A8|nr:sugar transferase [Calothrix rhizosoleniae]